MPTPTSLFVQEYFPKGRDIPFGNYLNQLFFNPRSDNSDFVIHGPNVVRLTKALVKYKLDEPGLLSGTEEEKERTCFAYRKNFPRIHDALGVVEGDGGETLRKTELFISIAAMFHDIGKTIRKANHPQIGFNLLRNLDQEQSNLLVQAFQYPGERDDDESKYNRFSLLCSTTQHHDKFGVVSTGEGALPIFSDILYFISNEEELIGIVKNVTSVMLLNLGDIAAVVPGSISQQDRDAALKIANQIIACRSRKASQQKDLLLSLTSVIKKPSCCLGLEPSKVRNVISDWSVLVDSIQDPEVKGSRALLKRRLLHLEQNPTRTIDRILRLLMASADTCNADRLISLLTPAFVESVLVGALGSHQFQYFCQQFASVVKLDYSLNFFKAIVCACTRKALGTTPDPSVKGSWSSLSENEAEMLATLPRQDLQHIVNHVTSLFVKVLHGITTRYASVLESGGLDARRFGFQMRELTSDNKIREAIVDLLCIQESKDHVALTWIADEVSIWSLD